MANDGRSHNANVEIELSVITRDKKGVLKRQLHVVLDWLLTSHFEDGKTTVTRPFTIGFRSSGPPHVSGSAAHDPGFIRV